VLVRTVVKVLVGDETKVLWVIAHCDEAQTSLEEKAQAMYRRLGASEEQARAARYVVLN
jgi:hypothetical protein